MTMSAKIPMKSSNIAAIAYDPDTKTLEVEFTNGNRYQYEGVSPATFAAFQSAPSAGTFFHANVRAQFKGSKL